MIRYQPDSNSAIAKATHIVQVRLREFQASEWVEPPDFELEATPEPEEGAIVLPVDHRDVQARVAPQRIWKGDVDEESMRERLIRFRQYRYRNIIRFKLPGVWSSVELTPGMDYFLLLQAASAAYLEEPHCFFAGESAEVYRDIEMADRSGCPSISLRALLQDCAAHVPTAGRLFLEYAAGRIPETFFQHPADFDFVFRQMENPDASARLRWMWLRETFGWLTMMDPAPPMFIARTVLGCFRLAQRNESDLNAAMLGVYLPNLLGLTSGLVRKSAAETFGAFPVTRTSAIELLEANPQWPGRQPLLDWLRQ
ncbi:MAG: hypothetical protein JNL62_04355 [Bryobacterales bacterium]|nr:hypothetical protein [Bryobacterales bacterium]